MTINAKEKIVKIVDELLPMDNTIPCEHYRNERAIELFYKFSYFFNVKKLLRQYKHQYLQYAIDSYTYPNGLIRLESYCVLNGEHVINQTIITDNLESNNAIVHIWNKYELKSLQQFFIKSESSNSIFGYPRSWDKDRNIETNETEIEIDNMVIGRFSRINKDNSSIVYAEKYMPINRLTNWNLELKDSSTNVELLEILYRYNDKPAFAQLLDNNGKSLLEGTQYNPNNYKDAEMFVNSVINEVDEIVKEITTIIVGYDKKVDGNVSEKVPTKVLKLDDEHIKRMFQMIRKDFENDE